MIVWLVAWAWPAGIFGAEVVSRYDDPFPQALSKKGLQVELVPDAIALGVKHAAINVNLAQLVDPQRTSSLRWQTGAGNIHFQEDYVHRLDATIRELSQHDIVVYLILLVYRSDQPEVNRIVLHPHCAVDAPNQLGAFNTVTQEGRDWLSAACGFLAERWSRPDREWGHVSGYIVGNEVNSHWWWCNMGRVSLHEFVPQYASAVRIVHDAVRSQSSGARVYISLEHHWNMRYAAGDERQSFSGRSFLDEFARYTRQEEGGDYDWHVAYHPYPENLFEPRFWQDKTALPSPDSPRITFKNLSILTSYLQRPELTYCGTPRRVILSEQGFHTPEGPQGESVQAASYCYAYRIVEQLGGIDAFILHRHVDHPHEGGLKLGLRRYMPGETDPRPIKQIYNCFRDADSPNWEASFRFALPIVGLTTWSEVGRDHSEH